MHKNAVFFVMLFFFISTVSPVFAEVTQMQLDRDLYFINDSIYLNGKVTDDSSGIVTIVLRDPDDQFVLLSQAIIEPDNSFEKIISIDDKFQITGTYNATAFVLNMTEGKAQSFDVLLNDFEENKVNPPSNIESPNFSFDENKIIENTVESNSKESNFKFEDLTYEQTNPFIPQKSKIADFVDPLKSPQYYMDRYYNEPDYKSWFDRNYPDLTIEEAVGYTNPSSVEITNRVLENQIIPKAEAAMVSPIKDEKNNDISILVLTISGFVILFAATYGIKRKSESNSKITHINKTAIKKFFSINIGSNPSKIIQTRLAKGEITLEQFEKLKEKIYEN
jgi:hypothetical protein